MKRADAVGQLKQTWAILNADLDSAVEYGRIDNTPYAQRALARAFFAVVEGLSYQMRQVTLASLVGTEFITEQEVQLLREVRHSLDEKGNPKETPVFLLFPESPPLSSGLRFRQLPNGELVQDRDIFLGDYLALQGLYEYLAMYRLAHGDETLVEYLLGKYEIPRNRFEIAMHLAGEPMSSRADSDAL